jgi:hypothetical protein
MGPHVAILIVLCVANVEICRFWTEKWTKVPSLSFSITHVLSMKKKIKTKKTKK